MKKILLILSFLSIATLSQAQYALDKGKLQLNAGLGLSNWGLPVYVGLDYGVHKDISVGGEISFRNYSPRFYSYNIIGISANGNYHFNYLLKIPKQWDLYAGLNLGFFVWTGDVTQRGSPLGVGAQVGGRYYFTDKFGFNLELGGGNAFGGGKIGITYKF
jgi:hypothetical protein